MTLRAIVLVFMLLSGFLGVEASAITTTIQKPQSEKELEGTVEVSFRIDMAGKVEILSINASSPQLADYVIKKLNKIKLEKGDPQIGQVIKYRFVFKKQA
jgi:outer membrane biosynthesis protein TonB